jgi:hypothetical protein
MAPSPMGEGYTSNMRKVVLSRFAFFSGVVLMSLAFAQVQRESPITRQANRFLKSLSAEQKAIAIKPFSDDYRTRWQYVPAIRQGINFGAMTHVQEELAIDLLKASLSSAGYKKTEVIRSLEKVLFDLENGNKGRDGGLYTFTFFGEPTQTGKWGWRYEGHHVSLNFTFKDGELISSTPQFFGSNPAEVRSGPSKGLRALPQEEDFGFEMLNSLSTDQLKQATIPGTPPGDVVSSSQRQTSILAATGVKYTDLDAKQKAVMIKLLHLYSDAQTTQESKRRWGRIDTNSLVFAWIGGTKPGDPHYYRIQGSKFLVEFDNTQNNANHIHSVWRDFDGDFGEDVLAEHYTQGHSK